jgi:hypothetical protein
VTRLLQVGGYATSEVDETRDPLNTGLHWALCGVVLPRPSSSEGGQHPGGKPKIYDSLHAGKSAYTEAMNLLTEHLGYVWASRGYADQRVGDVKAKPVWTRRLGELPWRGSALVSPSETRCQAKAMGLTADYSHARRSKTWWTACHRRGAAMAVDAAGSRNASMNRRRLIVLIAAASNGGGGGGGAGPNRGILHPPGSPTGGARGKPGGIEWEKRGVR